MTRVREMRDLIARLVHSPRGKPTITREEFLRFAQSSNGADLSASLLQEAVDAHSSDDVALALIVAFQFDISGVHIPLLVSLGFSDWHKSHEDVVEALSGLRDPTTLAVLIYLANHIPEYLNWDESRALARKAIWAIGEIPGEKSRRALDGLSKSDDEIVRESALEQIERWRGSGC
ncbi:HEAT repeat domain-containing protein [Amycolatopsis sp. NPDC049253]|uniref:HEAT repeat domain-containing protein n=1 Tax=Amycolatopsis sp. NPDC049253 TaxID=3155274 RepID=UPI003432C359